ncbi:MAG: ATP synthase F1 subunit gamma [Planctomycetota bacterium]|nr:MAG: ATP synthase F1 subunit gamma [Planctomycetota bacterium]
MANPRALDKRRRSVRNIRKITRTMELIATARFKKAMDRAHAATAYTERMTQLVRDLAQSGAEVKHPLLAGRTETKNATLLVLTANRGLCGGYNGNVIRAAYERWTQLKAEVPKTTLEVSGKRGITGFSYRGQKPDERFTHFDDKPSFEEVEVIAARYLDAYAAGTLDRLDVAYMKFINVARQTPVVETLLPLGSLSVEAGPAKKGQAAEAQGQQTGKKGEVQYEFLPSAESILQEVVPASFKVKLFKCFLDAAVSEQVARMVAMKGATENAGELIKQLSMTYNRARQGRITGELLEVMGGVEALNK